MLDYIIIIIGVVFGGITTAISLKIFKKNNTSEEKLKNLEKENYSKQNIIENLNNEKNILQTKIESFEQLKIEKTQIQERLKLVEIERNNLKNENTKLIKEEENRNETLRKSVESTNTLQAKTLNIIK